MSRVTTRIGGWPVVSVREGDSAWVTSIGYFDQEVPESLDIVFAGMTLHANIEGVLPEIRNWQDDFIWHTPQHMLTHGVDDAEDCADCAYAALIMICRGAQNSGRAYEPLPVINSGIDSVAVWHKGRRVTSMSGYFTAQDPVTKQRVHLCHVEALSVTGEILCATARLDEITYTHYRKG